MAAIGSILFNVLALLVTLGILVTVHEYGHYRAGRYFGVQIERFSIGMGKVLFAWRGNPDPKNLWAPPTEFAISLLPLGGYVKMFGEQDPVADAGREVEPVPALTDEQRRGALTSKPPHQRAVIYAAGPVANFLLAIVLYWLMFVTGVSGLAPVVGFVEPDSSAAQADLRPNDEIVGVNGKATETWQAVRMQMLDRLGETGALQLTVKNPDATQSRELTLPIVAWLSGSEEPDPLADLGIVPFHQHLPAKIDTVLPEGRAAAAGIQTDDLITAANSKPVQSWSEWLAVVQANPEQDLQVGIERDGLALSLTLRPAVRLDDTGQPLLSAAGQTQGYIGAAVQVPMLPEWMNRSERLNPLTAVPKAFTETWDNVGFVLSSMKKMLIGLISVKNLSGPLTIAQVAGQTASIGLEYYLGFLAVLSISLGIFNLLPIPILDGGHLLYCGVEALIRRPVPRQLQEWGMQIGLLLVAGFMFLALYNDISRLL